MIFTDYLVLRSSFLRIYQYIVYFACTLQNPENNRRKLKSPVLAKPDFFEPPHHLGLLHNECAPPPPLAAGQGLVYFFPALHVPLDLLFWNHMQEEYSTGHMLSNQTHVINVLRVILHTFWHADESFVDTGPLTSTLGLQQDSGDERTTRFLPEQDRRLFHQTGSGTVSQRRQGAADGRLSQVKNKYSEYEVASIGESRISLKV